MTEVCTEYFAYPSPLYDIKIIRSEFFTDTQIEILKLIAEGNKLREIADILHANSALHVEHYLTGMSNSGSEKLQLGIYGIVEGISGKRPTKPGLIYDLLNLGILELKPIEK